MNSTSLLRRRQGWAAALTMLCAVAGIEAAPRVTEHFDTGWRFHLGNVAGAEQPAFDDNGWRQLNLPHDWSVEQDFSPTNASGTGFLPGGTGWYRKQFTLSEDLRGRRVTIEFDGIYRNSDVWINGQHLGHRPNGYVGFQYDLTPHLRFGSGGNVLAVRVERENVADSRWYTGTGIYRHVRLVHTDPVHVAPWGVFVSTPEITAESASVNVTAEVSNGAGESKELRVVNEVLDANNAPLSKSEDRQSLASGETRTFTTWQKIENPSRWSPSSPTQYTLLTRVFVDDRLVDEVQTPFGIRQFHFDPDEGFILNGTNMLIKGLCMHHDAGVVGAAVPIEVLERRLRLAKGMGANAIRCSHNPMAPELYSLCDQIGLLVMDEAFDEWEIGKRKWARGRNVGTAGRFGYAEHFEEWAERDLADMVRQHRNHPSIILWSLGNEIDYPTDPYVHPESRVDADFAGFSTRGQPSVTRLTAVAPRLIAAVKQHDPTRPVTMALANVPAANGTGLADMLDVAGYNYQENEYERDHANHPNRVIYGSENGRRAESWFVVKNRDYISALFLWVGFDFLGEAGEWPWQGSTAGVFDRCGFIKSNGLQFEAMWKDEPVVRLVSSRGRGANDEGRRRRRSVEQHWTWDVAAGSEMNVVAYSNCDEVELLINGKSLGRERPDEAATVRWELPYEPGELAAVGFKDGVEQTREILRTAQEPARLSATVDRSNLSTGGVAHVILEVVDANGVRVPGADMAVTVAVSGAGDLLGLDNGRQNDPTPLRSSTRVPNEGRLLALVRAGAEGGELVFTASAEGIEEAVLRIPVD